MRRKYIKKKNCNGHEARDSGFQVMTACLEMQKATSRLPVPVYEHSLASCSWGTKQIGACNFIHNSAFNCVFESRQ